MEHMTESKGRKGKFKEKIDTLNRFLNDEHALLHLCPRVEGVSLPTYLMDNPTVTLKLSRYFRGALDISTTDIRTELLFNDKYFTCIIPFEAVWGMTSFRGQFLMWPESTPQEVFDTIIQQAQSEGPKMPVEDEMESDQADESQPPKKEIRKGHLKRIK